VDLCGVAGHDRLVTDDSHGGIGDVIGQLDKATMAKITTQLAVMLGFGE
jgi:hypothetical protein